MSLQVLLPLDGSPFSEQALPFAGALALRSNAVLHLVQVHRTTKTFDAHSVASVTVEWERRVSEREYLGRLAEWLRDEYGCAVRSSVLHGGIVTSLENYIRDENIGLVVMTSHGQSGVRREWLGSSADGLVRSSTVPVFLLRPQVKGAGLRTPTQLGKILIPLDGSALAEQIIEPALALGGTAGTRYRLVQVVPPERALSVSTSPDEGRFSRAESKLRPLSATEYLERIAEGLRARGYAVDTTVITHWNAPAAILDLSRNGSADMIAMATRGRGGWQRIAFGSVTDRVQRNTSLPMLLVQPVDQNQNAPFAEAVGD